MQLLQQRQGHWRIEPDDRIFAIVHQLGQQRCHERDLVVMKAHGMHRRMRLTDGDAGCRRPLFHVTFAVVINRLFDKQDAVMLTELG